MDRVLGPQKSGPGCNSDSDSGRIHNNKDESLSTIATDSPNQDQTPAPDILHPDRAAFAKFERIFFNRMTAIEFTTKELRREVTEKVDVFGSRLDQLEGPGMDTISRLHSLIPMTDL